jgi:murein DD-endopeptidase MepM/ murein hydrolase activator NlpD
VKGRLSADTTSRVSSTSRPRFRSVRARRTSIARFTSGSICFAQAGTVVLAPLDGTVHAFADNAFPQDYGPVIILRHETDGGDEFFTLYGHLSRESIRELRVGDRVHAGAPIATLGAPDVNGGWTPHLHLQVMLDLLGLGTDFPGVAPPSRRRAWIALCPDPNLLVCVPESRFAAPDPTPAHTLEGRRDRIGGNLSVAYTRPVKIVRGWMQYLYDDEGRCFIDAYNNVPHVGHCHPRVVAAGVEQMRVLNTNTRYLHDKLAAYAEKLLATLPPELDVCYFVNSASEANELALRLARAHTGARDMIVLDAAYHGNTTSLIDISPYKHAGTGGTGAPDWVHVAPLADDYRGPFKRGDPSAGPRYAAMVGEIIASLKSRNRRLAGFIAETCPSVGGQLVFPSGYLRDVYRFARDGGRCLHRRRSADRARTDGDELLGVRRPRVSYPTSSSWANPSATVTRSALWRRRARSRARSTTAWSSSAPLAATPCRARSGWRCSTSCVRPSFRTTPAVSATRCSPICAGLPSDSR